MQTVRTAAASLAPWRFFLKSFPQCAYTTLPRSELRRCRPSGAAPAGELGDQPINPLNLNLVGGFQGPPREFRVLFCQEWTDRPAGNSMDMAFPAEVTVKKVYGKIA